MVVIKGRSMSPTLGQLSQEHRLVMSRLMSRTVQGDALLTAGAQMTWQSQMLNSLAWETELHRELAPPSFKQSLQLCSSSLCTKRYSNPAARKCRPTKGTRSTNMANRAMSTHQNSPLVSGLMASSNNSKSRFDFITNILYLLVYAVCLF